MKGTFLLVWLALASLVRTKPVIEEGNYGGSNFYLNNEEDYYPDEESDDSYSIGYKDYSGDTYPYEEGDENYGNGYEDYSRDSMKDYYDGIQTNKMCSDFAKQITFSYKSSIGAQRSIVESFLVTKMEALIVFIQNNVAIAQRKQKAGEDFAYDSNELNNLWGCISPSQNGPFRFLYKYMLQKYITAFGYTLNVFMQNEARARSELEGAISRGIDNLVTYTQQKDWRNGEVSQFEEDAECFYDLMKSELNYTMGDMTKEDFGNVARNLAHSLHVIATSSGIETSITDIALDAANKLKTVNFEEIKNDFFEAIDIVSDKIVQTVEILDRSLQFGVWQMALDGAVPLLDGAVPRLDNLILKVIGIVKSDNFWIQTEQLHWKTAIKYIKPVMLNMVDLVAELSNEVDIAYEMEEVAALIEEAIGSANIDGQEVAAAIEQYLYTSIEEYLLVLENLGSLDRASLMPLLRYGIENTKPINDHEAIRTQDDQVSDDDNGQDAPKKVSTGDYEEIQDGSGSIEDVSVEFQEGSDLLKEDNFSSNSSAEINKGSISKSEKNTSKDGYVEVIEEDVLMLAEEKSSDDNSEMVEDVLIIEEEDSSDGYKEIVEEDVSVIAIQDSNSEIEAEEDYNYKDIVEENGNENIEIEEAYGFVYHA